MKKNLSESIRARLLNTAKKEHTDFQQILIRFASERLLYRISESNYADQFLLKGAMLFSLWYGMSHRPTRNIDLLAFGDDDLAIIQQVFHNIMTLQYNDGIIFQPETISVEPIRETSGYSGARVTVKAELAKALCKTQIDIGFGDIVTPQPIKLSYPTLINDLPAPKLGTYPVYTVIAEKLHAIALLGLANSRLKDYLDLLVMFEREKLDNTILHKAILATFTRRGMMMPTEIPTGLSDEFANDNSRQTIWRAFLSRNNLPERTLINVISELRSKVKKFFLTEKVK